MAGAKGTGRRAAVACAAALAILAATPAPALAAGFLDFEGMLRESAQGMVEQSMEQVAYLNSGAVPTSFADLLNSGGTSAIFTQARQFWGGSVIRPIAASLLSLVMLVRLVKVAERVDGHATLPAVREVVQLMAFFVVFAYLINHSWDICAAVFGDLSQIWRGWADIESAAAPAAADLSGVSGLNNLVPVWVAALVQYLMLGAASLLARVVMWARGVQLYFMATLSPIPMALLGMEETRQMGVGFLRSLASLVLAYAANVFVLWCFPTLVGAATVTTWVHGGVGALNAIMATMASSALLIFLLVRSGGWARDLLGG